MDQQNIQTKKDNRKALMAVIIAIIVVLLLLVAYGVWRNYNYSGQAVIGQNQNQTVKEFTVQSFVDLTGSQPKPQFSLKEMTVNKGDKVRIKLTVVSGNHDFKLDEFNIYEDTREQNKEYIIEFTADKTGEFIYYCNKPGHRAAGHWGTLKVL